MFPAVEIAENAFFLSFFFPIRVALLPNLGCKSKNKPNILLNLPALPCFQSYITELWSNMLKNNLLP